MSKVYPTGIVGYKKYLKERTDYINDLKLEKKERRKALGTLKILPKPHNSSPN